MLYPSKPSVRAESWKSKRVAAFEEKEKSRHCPIFFFHSSQTNSSLDMLFPCVLLRVVPFKTLQDVALKKQHKY